MQYTRSLSVVSNVGLPTAAVAGRNIEAIPLAPTMGVPDTDTQRTADTGAEHPDFLHLRAVLHHVQAIVRARRDALLEYGVFSARTHIKVSGKPGHADFLRAEHRPCASVVMLYVYTQLSQDEQTSCSAGAAAAVGLNARLLPHPPRESSWTEKACGAAAGCCPHMNTREQGERAEEKAIFNLS